MWIALFVDSQQTKQNKTKTRKSYGLHNSRTKEPNMKHCHEIIALICLFVIASADGASFLSSRVVTKRHDNENFVSSSSPSFRLWARRGNKQKAIQKQDLPSKTCVVCGRPFTWRKKWERCWDEVTCCSKACNAQRRRNKNNKNNVVADDFED